MAAAASGQYGTFEESHFLRLLSLTTRLGPDGRTFVGPQLVAKESRFAEDVVGRINNSDRRNFHKVFCKTQQKAQKMADAFNKQLDAIPGASLAPRVKFLDCSVYVVHDVAAGEVGLLVEKMLDVKAYKKWNSNNGYVDGKLSSDVPEDFSPEDSVVHGISQLGQSS